MTTATTATYSTAYSGARGTLATAGLFELAVENWGQTDEAFGAVPITRLFQIIGGQGQVITHKLLALENDGGANLSVAGMFELQLKVQRLCQMTEMGTSLTTAISGCLQSIARNTK
ncbi:DUF5407 family protein [Candidatus Similichlamydia epinepheli]|uniref:DUF5407 family protein n=1 Tax=Candidatus Similichlamydia epinepheli TaxID=1903953 RepID=UPI000D38EC49|nr:DUF5407 family protein [Candidatus Similichlamydia epinepheli]